MTASKQKTFSDYLERLADAEQSSGIMTIQLRESDAKLGGPDEDTEITITIADRDRPGDHFDATCRLGHEGKFELIEMDHSDPNVSFVEANPPEYVYDAINSSLPKLDVIYGTIANDRYVSRDAAAALESEITADPIRHPASAVISEPDLVELCKEYFSNTHPGVDPSDVDRISREMAAKHLSDPSILDQVVADMMRVNAAWTETRRRLAGDQPRDLSGLDALSRKPSTPDPEHTRSTSISH